MTLISFEREMTGEDAAEVLLKYKEHVRFLDGLPGADGDTYNAIMMKCAELDRHPDPTRRPIRYIREISEDYAVRLVREFPGAIRYLKNPTERVLSAAGQK